MPLTRLENKGDDNVSSCLLIIIRQLSSFQHSPLGNGHFEPDTHNTISLLRLPNHITLFSTAQLPNMASHDEDTMPEETQGYKLSQPKQSMAEYQQLGECTYKNLPMSLHSRKHQWLHLIRSTFPSGYVSVAKQASASGWQPDEPA